MLGGLIGAVEKDPANVKTTELKKQLAGLSDSTAMDTAYRVIVVALIEDVEKDVLHGQPNRRNPRPATPHGLTRRLLARPPSSSSVTRWTPPRRSGKSTFSCSKTKLPARRIRTGIELVMATGWRRTG